VTASPTLSEVLSSTPNARFAGVIDALSDQSPGPAGENLVSNEDSYPRVVAEIKRLCPGDGVYLGVGPDQNFTLIAAARPKLALVMDYRRRNLLLHLVHKAFFALSSSRVDYLSVITARKPEVEAQPDLNELVNAFLNAPLDRAWLAEATENVKRVLEPLKVVAGREWKDLATIQAKLAGPGLNARFLALKMYPTLGQLIQTQTPDRNGQPGHFLGSERAFKVVLDLQTTDRVIPFVGDFGQTARLIRLGDWLRSHALKVGLIYLSDVEFFLMRSGRYPAFVRGLEQIPWSDGALLVRASTREIAHPDRVEGDSSTTSVHRVANVLSQFRKGRLTTVDELFSIEPAS